LGSENVKAKIVIALDHSPEKFRVNDDLARLLGLHTDTKARLILAIWQYVKMNKLQDPTDKKVINNDAALKQIFGVDKMLFTSIASRILPLLAPVDPIIIDYTIRYDY
jgi:SWI/SNF-related matrix-associated actin-dependent regulator of chromatin subfamily D